MCVCPRAHTKNARRIFFKGTRGFQHSLHLGFSWWISWYHELQAGKDSSDRLIENRTPNFPS